MTVAITKVNDLYVDGNKMDVAQLKTALKKLGTAHGSVILYIEGGSEIMFDMEVNRAISDSWVPISISTEPDFSTVVLANGPVKKRE